MIPWELLDSAPLPGSQGELTLHRRGTELSIRVNRKELMNSRLHGSEEALARIACRRIAGSQRPHVLVGGLGMGYTLSAALRELGPGAKVLVVELSPAVVAWNRGALAELAGRPLQDPRVELVEGDVADSIRAGGARYDAILLDVDNGPRGLSHEGNDWLYQAAGLDAALAALRPGGVLGLWSAAPDHRFAERLRGTGFKVEELRVKARGDRGGHKHTIWIAERGAR